ncbi:MAG: hypothetical protein ACM65L_27425 [Microcoleus sp.]
MIQVRAIYYQKFLPIVRSIFFTQAIALRTIIAQSGIWCEGRSLI